MPHLRLEVPQEWLSDDFRVASGFDAKALMDLLVKTIADMRMEKPGSAGLEVPVVNIRNLKHAIVPLVSVGVGGDPSQSFLHLTFAMGNDTPGRTADVRCRIAHLLGSEIDRFAADISGLVSVTVHVQDIDRDRGYSTTAERLKNASE